MGESESQLFARRIKRAGASSLRLIVALGLLVRSIAWAGDIELHATDFDNTMAPHVADGMPAIAIADLQEYARVTQGLVRLPVTGSPFWRLQPIMEATGLDRLFREHWIVSGGQRLITPDGKDLAEFADWVKGKWWERQVVVEAMRQVMGQRRFGGALTWQDQQWQSETAVKWWFDPEKLPQPYGKAYTAGPEWFWIRDELLIPALKEAGLAAHFEHIAVTVSHDSVRKCGNLDLTPVNADKERALGFYLRYRGIAPAQTLFTGDSGNDACVANIKGLFAFGLPGNAQPDLATRLEAKRRQGLLIIRAPSHLSCIKGVNHVFREAHALKR